MHNKMHNIAQVKKMLARLEWYVSAAGGGMVEPQQWTPPYQARPLVLPCLALSCLVLQLLYCC
eukprot:COSAG06_NODE_5925_length_3206_cov_2.760541_4_plen_63_part_00